MSRRAGYLIALVTLVGAMALAALLMSLAPEPERHEPPPPMPYVETAEILAGSSAIPVHGAGTVRPSVEIGVAPQVGGRVVWVDPGFRSGGRVAQGQTLFRIEEADYQYRVQEAESALAARRVALLEAQEDAAIARAEYESYAGQQGDGAAPVPASPLTLREPQLEAAEAALRREQALLREAKLALTRTRIKAPFNGFVRNESVDLGQLVAPGELVGRLFAADAAEVVVPLSDGDAALIPGLWTLAEAGGQGGAGQQVAARVIADYGGVRYAWPGHVDRAERSLDERTRTIDVVVQVPNPFAPGKPVESVGHVLEAPPLLVGKFAEVEIEGVAPVGYFRIRRAALQQGNEIWTVGRDGAVLIVPVQVLQRSDDEVFVTGALQGHRMAITSGLQFATDGMIVRISGSDSQG